MGPVFGGSELACGSVYVCMCSSGVSLCAYLGGDSLSPVVMFVTDVRTGCVCPGGGIVIPSTICVAVYVVGEMDAWLLYSSIMSRMSCICSAGGGGVFLSFLGVADLGVVGNVFCVSSGVAFVVLAFSVFGVCVVFVSGDCCVGVVGLCAPHG